MVMKAGAVNKTLLCKIAEIGTEIPASESLISRCKEYLCDENNGADIIIRTELYNNESYLKSCTEESIEYMESARQFYSQMIHYGGFYLHSSAVAVDGKAYLFSADPGVGKSTHVRLWQQIFGEKAKVFNDDKPALRCMDGKWFAYGTPWCGKDGININMKTPVAGICFLKQAPENRIRQLSMTEALAKLLPQTIYKFKNVERLDLLLNHVDDLLRKIPIFELENRPEPEAARLSYETMYQAAEEMGL